MARRRNRFTSRKERSGWGSVFAIVGLALLFRALFFQPFTIPSGSMQPGLVQGDYILVSKFATGYGRHSFWPIHVPLGDRVIRRGPERGDVVVFRPEGVRRDYIKRVVGLPGERVRMENDTVFVDGSPLDTTVVPGSVAVRRPGNTVIDVQVREEATPGGRSYLTAQADLARGSGAEEVVLGPDDYFVLGDDRDNSKDSRAEPVSGGAGIVKSANIVGEARLVVLSVEDDFVLWKPWTWGRVRGDRWLKVIR